MKKTALAVLLLVVMGLGQAWAAETKQVDLRPQGELRFFALGFQLGIGAVHYLVDRKAGLCFMVVAETGTSPVDCKKLEVYPEIKEYLATGK